MLHWWKLSQVPASSKPDSSQKALATMPIQGKNLNSGIRGGLWERKHYDAIGSAIWLFGWCVLRQTKQNNGVGLVLGGKPLTYQMIADDTGYDAWQIRRWMAVLKDKAYIRVRHTNFKRMILYVLNAKKFSQVEALSAIVRIPHVSNGAESARYDGSHRAESARSKHRAEVKTEQIREGGGAAAESPDLFFKGEVLSITADDEVRLAEAFPSLDRYLEYRNADEWCIDKQRKGKAVELESVYMFMRRWLLRTEKNDMKTQSEAHVGRGPWPPVGKLKEG